MQFSGWLGAVQCTQGQGRSSVGRGHGGQGGPAQFMASVYGFTGHFYGTGSFSRSHQDLKIYLAEKGQALLSGWDISIYKR